MSREMMNNWDHGHGLTENQGHRLGIRRPDPFGNGIWIFGQFWEAKAMKPGMALRHAGAGEIADGTVTAEAPEGTNLLKDTSEFAADDFVGALGTIYDGKGEGQNFYVVEMVDPSTIRVVVLTGTTDRSRDTGWRTALDSTSKFRLWMPGRFYIGDGNTKLNAGVIQTAVTPTAGYRPYGWIKCTGDSPVLVDISDTIAGEGAEIEVVDGGLVKAGTTNPVGRMISSPATHASEGDTLGRAELDFPFFGPSYRFEGGDHPLNRVDVV